jgi:hypothetical protein
MTQRDQNGNGFCGKAAMRQRQSLTIFCDTFSLQLRQSYSSSVGHLPSSRTRDRLDFVTAIDRTARAPGTMLNTRLEISASKRK